MATKKTAIIIEPVKPMKLPPELKGVPNGELSPALLHRIRGGGRLFVDAAAKFNEMYVAAQAAQVELINQGDYRSYAAQKALFLDRYQREASGRQPEITRATCSDARREGVPPPKKIVSAARPPSASPCRVMSATSAST